MFSDKQNRFWEDSERNLETSFVPSAQFDFPHTELSVAVRAKTKDGLG